MTEAEITAIKTARVLLDLGHPLSVVLINPLIDPALRDFVEARLERERIVTLVPARELVADRSRDDWLKKADRSKWHYWPALRQMLLTKKGWDLPAVRSLDDSSDRILRQLAAPWEPRFDVRGLVLGFVQSGKTANYTALIAKAADSGYRLIVVLSGIDNGLRRQTQIRLKKELVGHIEDRPNSVPLPPMGQQWHEFTSADLDGDFRPGFANVAALQGSQPVLLVIKKNGPVLRRLLRWLEDAPDEIRSTLPVLVVDDEADQASVDTRGSYLAEDDIPDGDYEEPSVINGLIRDLLKRFQRRAYVAYTATPFANILIPHDTVDPNRQNDLYPKDFIIDLPKPVGYFGAEEFFGRADEETGEVIGGIDVIRNVSDEDLGHLENGALPPTLKSAIEDFALAGAARAVRGGGALPSTMLIHASARIERQAHLKSCVEATFNELRDEWRYQRGRGIRERLASRWETEFRPVTRARHLDRDIGFDAIEDELGPFMEAIEVREVNSATGEVLDYERQPSLKAIAVGGNRLSRGLTLEGLLVSFFVRRSITYDTLMQMGRWFGFREGYDDLTRIYTTAELAGWFSDLAHVEHRLREDIGIYESQGLSPAMLGPRIWQHPAMQVTSPLKRRFASATTIAQSYSGQLEQTFKFPFRRPEDLAALAENNRLAVGTLLRSLGAASRSLSDDQGPVWQDVGVDRVLQFLVDYRVDEQIRTLSLPLIRAYLEKLSMEGELTRWVIAVRGRGRPESRLKAADWGVGEAPIWQVSRSRIKHTDSVGVITSPVDEAIGIPSDRLGDSQGVDARLQRSPEEGLLLLYPISRYSGYDLAEEGGNRCRLYENPDDVLARDLVGIALSFPQSTRPQKVEGYLVGTVGWRPAQ